MPIGVAPTAGLAWARPDGDAEVAAGAAAAGSFFWLSMRAGTKMETVAEACARHECPWGLQVYVLRDRDVTVETVRRAVQCGATALALTVDSPEIAPRPGDGRPGPGALPEFRANLRFDGDPAALGPANDLAPSTISWLRETSGVPVVVKGVLDPRDAVVFANAGAAAIWVSNHGGRQFDLGPSHRFRFARHRGRAKKSVWSSHTDIRRRWNQNG